MVITEDMIRRFPFAVKASRISARLEAEIGKDMRARAQAEGHFKGLPPAPQKSSLEAFVKIAEVEACVFRLIMAGFNTAWQLVQNSKHDRATIDRALAAMVADNRLLKSDQMRGSAGFRYTINGNYQPTRGTAA